MRHSLDELLDIIHKYYPREIRATEQRDDEARRQTEENARLIAARRQAAADERWHVMRQRISDRFPGMLMNRSLHLPTGNWDGCYSFTISPTPATDRTLWFGVSFLAPYYIVYSSRSVETVQQVEGFNVVVHGMHFYIPRSAADLGFMAELGAETTERATTKREEVTFDLLPDEQPYAAWITRDIEATFGCERMPPEVGTVTVPDVATNTRALGEVTLYDCLFTDNHAWLRPSPSEEKTRLEIDASRIPEPFLAVLTVLAALYHIGLILAGTEMQNAYLTASTDGRLRKEELQRALSGMRLLVETPMTLRAIAAARELEALLASWDGEGAPPSAMVAWASSFLANRV
jgi:hypothetical protein